MKMKIIFIVSMLVALNNFSQNSSKKDVIMEKIMTDSLFKSMTTFCQEVINDFTKTKVSKKNVDKFISYLRKNSAEEVQSLSCLSPQKTKKDTMIKYVRDDLMTLVGSNVHFQYITWDGWDGESPYVMFRFDLVHKDYNKQFVVITDTKKKIHTIFSVNSRF
jgi:hypothetical protein